MTKVNRRRFRSNPTRPTLEALEARLVPAAFYVNHLTDDGVGEGNVGSLRYCIDQANNASGSDTIDFQVLGAVHLTDTLHITGSVTITGAGSAYDPLVTIQRDTGSPLFGLFDLLGSADLPTNVTMSQLLLSGGDAGDSDGGAIANRFSALTLTECNLSDNSAANGGAVSVLGGSLVIDRSIIFRNQATGNGGGISVMQGSVEVLDSFLQQNAANASADSTGGGIYAGSSSSATTTRSVFGNNTASVGGGIGVDQSSLSVADSNFEQNVASEGDGGAIYVSAADFVTITGSSLYSGQARNGAGLFVESGPSDTLVSLINNTIAYNLASEYAGAIGTNAVSGNLTIDLDACTIVFNDGRNPGAFSAVYAHSVDGGSTTIQYRSTLFARNGHDHPSLGVFDPTTDHLVSLGHNLSDDGTGITPGVNGDIQATPGLARLGNYGGPTQTIPILAGPGKTGGEISSDYPYDQRGVFRGEAPSIGAFQFAESATTIQDGQTTQAYKDFGKPVGLQLTDNDHPLSGITVRFTITSGSATFGGASTITVQTDASGIASVTPTAGPFEGPGTMTAQVVAGEYGLPFSTDTTYDYTFTISPAYNPPPSEVVLTTSKAAVVEGESFTLSVDFADAIIVEPHSVDITWGDGKSQTIDLAEGVFSFSVTHVYTSGLPSSDPAEIPIVAVVHDSRGQTSEGSTSLAVVNDPPVLVIDLADQFIHTNETFARTGSVADAGGGEFRLTVDYGDERAEGEGEGAFRPLEFDAASRSFTLSHNYQSEGTYLVTVTIDDGRGGHDAVRFEVDVLLPGVPIDTASKTRVEPGTSVTVSEPGITVTLFHALVDGIPSTGQLAASLIVAVVPADVASTLNGSTTLDGKTITTAYDIRAINTGPLDFAIVVFHYDNDDADAPTLTYFDRVSGRHLPVDSQYLVVDLDARTITLTLNQFSTPRLQDLAGTVFTIAVPLAVPVSSVSAPPTVTPPSGAPLPLASTKQEPRVVAMLGVSFDSGSSGGAFSAAGQLVGRAAWKDADTDYSTGVSAVEEQVVPPPPPAPVTGVLSDLPAVPDDLITLPGPILTPGSAELPSLPEPRPTSPANATPAEEAVPPTEAEAEEMDAKDDVFTRLAEDPLEAFHGDLAEESPSWSGLTLAAVAILAARPVPARRLKSPIRTMAA